MWGDVHKRYSCTGVGGTPGFLHVQRFGGDPIGNAGIYPVRDWHGAGVGGKSAWKVYVFFLLEIRGALKSYDTSRVEEPENKNGSVICSCTKPVLINSSSAFGRMVVAFGVAINLGSALVYRLYQSSGARKTKKTNRHPIVSWAEISTDAVRG